MSLTPEQIKAMTIEELLLQLFKLLNKDKEDNSTALLLSAIKAYRKEIRAFQNDLKAIGKARAGLDSLL